MTNPTIRKLAALPARDAEAPDDGDRQEELRASREAAVTCPLGHYDLLLFSGDDARDFLQAQLTNDVGLATADLAQYGGYCSAQGRLLANFLLIAMPEGYLMHLPSAMSSSLVARLRKFVLRSKVHIEAAPDFRAIGIAGPSAVRLLEQAVGTPPMGLLEVARHPGAALLRLTADSYLVLGASGVAAQVWNALLREATPAGAHCWDGLQIRAGIPWILPQTQEQFIPQMIGLDMLGGVGFQKGCYPGQEIVARSQYLGNIKRRLRLGHVDGPAGPGDVVLSAGVNCGTLVNTAPGPDEGCDVLAVVQDSHLNNELRIASDQGARLALRPLPTTIIPEKT